MIVHIFHVGGLVENVFRGVQLRVVSAQYTGSVIEYMSFR